MTGQTLAINLKVEEKEMKLWKNFKFKYAIFVVACFYFPLGG
jgi:hypothetical protein